MEVATTLASTRARRLSRTLALTLTAVFALLAAFVLAGAAPTAASAKAPMLYHGNGFAIKPANFYNWEYRGHQSGMSGGQDVGGRKGSGNVHLPNGRIHWKSWGRKRAVGTGGLWTFCGTIKNCKSSPWYGTPNIRITAYRLERGHYSRVKITRTGIKKRQFMVLAYRGRPGREIRGDALPWKIRREVLP